ncbi:hypothetical protein CU044_6854 [Streptomyces sp. L-9-10]|uniref:hypothetical protein n=1 Tax=Streptomyces sp. L-9-10 TaxID=1478131 RepID=UPI00101DBEE2|nr:hypothetical protein [Streptomyces sp. L-9-10]RYJ20728.1 hypothetical protein CU044_6854 [Streptomyces sp. L-9-10]
MQLSDVPDLAHTRPRAVHWLATATAMAAVVALAGLLQPGAATASQSGSGSPKAADPGRAPLPAPDPSGVDFPLECGGVGTTVTKKSSGDLDGDGNPETVAVVRCAAGSGTPPNGVYVLTRAGGEGERARIVATLVDPEDKLTVGPDFAVRDGEILATLFGYSGPTVPSCCPDEEQRVSWRWQNGAFVRGERPVARSV